MELFSEKPFKELSLGELEKYGIALVKECLSEIKNIEERSHELGYIIADFLVELQEAERRIEELLIRDANGWISVKDKPCPTCERVIYYNATNNVMDEGYFEKNEKGETVVKNQDHEQNIKDITHWRPFAYALPVVSNDYLFLRHKRD